MWQLWADMLIRSLINCLSKRVVAVDWKKQSCKHEGQGASSSGRKQNQTLSFILFLFFNFSIIVFILLRICDDYCLIHDALYEGVSEKVQTWANTIERFLASTYQHGVSSTNRHGASAAWLWHHHFVPVDVGSVANFPVQPASLSG